MNKILKEKLMTTKEVAEQLKCATNTLRENAKKCLPNKVFQNGKQTFWTESEVTVLIEFMKKNQYTAVQVKDSNLSTSSTGLTPAFKIQQAMEIEKRINPEFPNYYIFSNGDIQNIKTGKKHSFELHKRCSDIQLVNKDGVSVHQQLARLVFLTFFDKYEVHHCDIDSFHSEENSKRNNDFENLALVSQAMHSYIHRLEKENKKLKKDLENNLFK